MRWLLAVRETFDELEKQRAAPVEIAKRRPKACHALDLGKCF